MWTGLTWAHATRPSKSQTNFGSAQVQWQIDHSCAHQRVISFAKLRSHEAGSLKYSEPSGHVARCAKKTAARDCCSKGVHEKTEKKRRREERGEGREERREQRGGDETKRRDETRRDESHICLGLTARRSQQRCDVLENHHECRRFGLKHRLLQRSPRLSHRAPQGLHCIRQCTKSKHRHTWGLGVRGST